MSIAPEQLDEIEKLAEAATPGPWNHSFEFIHPNDGGVSDSFIVCRHTKGGYDAAFIVAMREYALPMVKALREARAERDDARAACFRLETERNQAIKDRDASYDAIESARATTQRVRDVAMRKRNESKAEVERLREVVRQVHAMTGWSVDWTASIALRDIREITKGMVE